MNRERYIANHSHVQTNCGEVFAAILRDLDVIYACASPALW